MYTAPVFVMIYSVLFLGEKLTKLKLFSVLRMLVGCVLVSGIIGGLKFNLFGIAVGLMAGISYSAYNIFTKLEMRRGYNPVVANLYSFLFASIIGILSCKPGGAVAIFSAFPLKSAMFVLLLGILTSILPYLLYTIALKKLPVGTASALGIIEPMSASIFSFVLLGEKPGILSLTGIILIFGAVLLLSKSDNDK